MTEIQKFLRIAIIVLRIGLGGLFIYGGVMKFVPQPPPPSSENLANLPEHVIQIKEYIGGLKQTNFFWPMLGVVELVGGVMLVSQYLALLGAFLLLPVTVNIFAFHFFLTPHETVEVVMTILYLLSNLAIIIWYLPKLKPIFLNFKTIY